MPISCLGVLVSMHLNLFVRHLTRAYSQTKRKVRLKGRGSKSGGKYGLGGSKLGGGWRGKGKFGNKGGKNKCFKCGKSGHWAQQV